MSMPPVTNPSEDRVAIPEVLPLLPIDNAVLFPAMLLPLAIGGDAWVKLIDDTALGNKMIGVFWRTQPGDSFDPLALAPTGVAAQIVRMLRLPDGGVQVLLQGQARIQIEQLLATEPYPMARVRTLQAPEERSLELEGLARSALTEFQQIVQLNPSLPDELLGPPRFRSEMLLGEDEVGVVTGLAWTPAGGDLLFVEASAVPGNGQLILTGQLGDVMRESARAALTYTRARAELLGIPADFAQKRDIHIHVPAGAVPKDGPSAGITMASALVSALTDRPAYKHVAMTGEITLRGKVLPIGGLKEKLLAAQRAGVTKVLLPHDNAPDLRDVPEETRTQLEIVLVEHIDEVLPQVLHPQEVAVGADGDRSLGR